MYLGRIVEQGPARDVVRNPQHPYTRALLSVVPHRDPRQRSTPQILQGETPKPIDVPAAGCRFHPRCPVAEDRCRREDPALRPPAATVAAGHEAACLLAYDRADPASLGLVLPRRRGKTNPDHGIRRGEAAPSKVATA